MDSGLDAAALAANPRVLRVGLLTGRDRLDALAAANVVVYPSRDEVFGLVPLEALLAGTPVIVCNDSGAGEIIGTVGGGHIVPPGDDDSLAGAIASMLAANALWRQRARTAARPRAPALRRRRGVRPPRRALPRRAHARPRAEPPHGMTDPRPGVSVVMPVYNGRRWLRAALDAIDAQRDGRPFEVIAVDDGSRTARGGSSRRSRATAA